MSDPQPKQDQDEDIEVTYRDDEGPPAESQEADSHHENIDAEPEGSNRGDQHEPSDTPSDELPEPQAAQAPLPALQGLLDRFEGGLDDFRAQYACDDPIVEEVIVSLAGELQRDQHRLEAHAQCLEHDDGDFGIEEPATPEPDEPREQDDPGAQDTLSSSETLTTTAATLDPTAVVQDFVKRRCTPSPDPVSHTDVMASINTWLDDQKRLRLNEHEVIRELQRLGFRDFNAMVSKKVETNTGWQWQGFQLLPFDAPDNEVDPFSSPNA
jgi:hypothetical protein